jgi:hypothetical protein
MKFNWSRRQQREAELDAEIRSHLDEAVRDRIERGESEPIRIFWIGAPRRSRFREWRLFRISAAGKRS